MPEKLPPQLLKDFSSGVVTNVAKNIVPKNSVAHAMNVDFDEEIGAAVSRLGTGIINAQVVDGKTCLGLHYFRDSVGTAHRLFVAMNPVGDATSNVYNAETGVAVTGATGLTASTKMRFLTYLDECLMINGVDAERSWNGSSVITTGGAFDLANVPGSNALKYCIEWNDRVYLAGNTAAGTSDTVYYSSTPTAGVISWTSGNGTVDIEREDGGGTITGFGKVPGYILIFKERSMKRWNFDSAFPESLVNIGTLSQESVINAAGLCAFYSASSPAAKGFYVTNGGRPVPISHLRAKNIKKWVDAIPAAYADDVSGWGDAQHFYWSIGDVTVDGTDYTNVVVRWSVSTGEWTIRSYPSEFRFWTNFVSSSANVITAGDDDGCVIQVDKASTYVDYSPSLGTTDSIRWEIQSHREDFDFNQIKEISEQIVIRTRQAQGAILQVKENGDEFVTLGEIGKEVQAIPLKRVLRGNYFVFRLLSNQMTGARAVIEEIEIPNIVVLDNY